MSSLFQDNYGLLVYDPAEDDFKLFYNNQKHKWIALCVKLSVSFQVFTELLRQSFPDRFQGKKVPSLVSPILCALGLSRVFSILYSNNLVDLQTCKHPNSHWNWKRRLSPS